MRLCVEKLIDDDENPAKRSKILLGLNFYGNSYTANGGGPIVGTEYIELLKNAKSNQVLTYNNNTAENYVEIRYGFTTLNFISYKLVHANLLI